jgi:hypothetical protein
MDTRSIDTRSEIHTPERGVQNVEKFVSIRESDFQTQTRASDMQKDSMSESESIRVRRETWGNEVRRLLEESKRLQAALNEILTSQRESNHKGKNDIVIAQLQSLLRRYACIYVLTCMYVCMYVSVRELLTSQRESNHKGKNDIVIAQLQLLLRRCVCMYVCLYVCMLLLRRCVCMYVLTCMYVYMY